VVDFNVRLVEALQLRNMKPAELSRISGISEGMISSYRHGNYKASQRNLEKLAKALNVSIPWLMGADVPITPSIPNASNIFPIERKKIPLLGKIACGKPIMSEEVFDGYVQCNGNIHADFCLRAEGDSMINARIYDGDIVFIRQQPKVENGEIAAVSIDDTVTLKRVYVGTDYIELKPENPTYKPLRFSKTEIEQFRIIGKAIAFQGDIV
jgi:repressor LexA